MGARKLEKAHDPAADVLGDRSQLTVRGHLTSSLLWFALNVQFAALPVVLPLQVLPFVAPGTVGTVGTVGSAQQATRLSWLTALSGLIALVVAPAAGAPSDRTAAHRVDAARTSWLVRCS